MMSKEYIDVFLKYLNQLYSYNKMKDNNFVISADMVYTILINYGVNNKEQKDGTKQKFITNKNYKILRFRKIKSRPSRQRIKVYYPKKRI